MYSQLMINLILIFFPTTAEKFSPNAHKQTDVMTLTAVVNSPISRE